MSIKVSILMPTYNDYKYIKESIESVFSQTYENWELLLINDGSTDKTEEIINDYRDDSRVKYTVLGQNRGQLNALAFSIKQITGNYVTMLHSDDKFYQKYSIEEMLNQIGPELCEGCFADIFKMDINGNINGLLKTTQYIEKSTIAAQLSLGGSNIISDVFFVRKDIFSNSVFPRYIQWNVPYYYTVADKELKWINLKKINPWYIYRVYDQNYIRSDIGKFEASNGCIRSSLELLEFFNIPYYRMMELITRVSLKILHRPFLFFKEKPFSGNYRQFIEFVLQNYYQDKLYLKNYYYESLLSFYDHFPSDQIVILDEGVLNSQRVEYFGKDARMFYNDILDCSLDPLYSNLLETAKSGFGFVKIPHHKYFERVKNALKFLNLKSELIVNN